MIEIDGSIGYGQVLRTAIGLSVLTLNPVKITNIRKHRTKPGLMPQHFFGVKTAAEFCHAQVIGLKLGSTEIEFIPQYHDFKNKNIDIGTAGSVTLLLQTLTPFLIFSDKKISLTIRGGTDVAFAPPTTYFQHVFCNYMKKIGVNIEMKTTDYGFYPKGGGRVDVEFSTVKKINPLSLTERGELVGIDAWSIASKKLQKFNVAERQLDALEKNLGLKLTGKNFMYVPSLSDGSSLHAVARYENCTLGANSLGERRKRSETVGEETAQQLAHSIQSNATFDKHMSDQIIPFIALADGKSEIVVEEITEHCRTNMVVCEKILGCKFDVNEETRKISVDGIVFGK